MSFGFSIKKDSLELLDEISLANYKRSYAYSLLKNPEDSFKAALEIFPLDKSAAIKISNIWPNDPDVVMFMREILDQRGEDEFLPSKNDLLKKVWDQLENKYLEPSDFVKLADQYAKLRDFYPEVKKDTSSINIVGDCAKVMVITSAQSDADWEEKSRALHNKNLLHNGD